MIGDRKIIEDKCSELGFKLVDNDFDYDLNRDARFKVICLKCGNESYKTFVTLVKKSCKCKFCHERRRNYHNSRDEILPLIKSACENNDYIFLDFVGGKWIGCRKTKLLVKCKNCGKITEKNYDNLVNKNSKCICHRIEKIKKKNVLSENAVKETINYISKINNFTFIYNRARKPTHLQWVG